MSDISDAFGGQEQLRRGRQQGLSVVIFVGTSEDTGRSAIAVPPMARHEDPNLHEAVNRRLIAHLGDAGILTFMFGDNTKFYNVSIGEYDVILNWVVDYITGYGWTMPSVGLDLGKIRDQIQIVKGMGFPTVVGLPFEGGRTNGNGTATALSYLSDKLSISLVLYLRDQDLMAPNLVAALLADGVVGWINCANVFELRAFTSGSVSVAPRALGAKLQALRADQFDRARWLRSCFLPLETCRDRFGSDRVLHAAVSRAVAPMGPVMLFWGSFCDAEEKAVANPASELVAKEPQLPSPGRDTAPRGRADA